MPLEESEIEALRARTRPYKVADGDGLTLLVQPTGAKWWRFRYRINGKEKMLSLGTYPAVSLAQARRLTNDARELLAQQIDPSIARTTNPRHARPSSAAARSNAAATPTSKSPARRYTIGAIASDWLASRRKELSYDAWRRYRWVLETYIAPQIGRRSIGSIRPVELATLVASANATRQPEVVRRVRQTMKQLLRHCLASGRLDHSTATRLYGALNEGRGGQ